MYAAVQTETEVMEATSVTTPLQGVNRRLADSLAATWNYSSTTRATPMATCSTRWARRRCRDPRGGGGALGGPAAAGGPAGRDGFDAVAGLLPAQAVVVDYEAAVAGVLSLGEAARDSLGGARRSLNHRTTASPRVEVAERYFLDYDSVAFVEAGVLQPESHSRVPGLRQRHDLPHPARNVHQAGRPRLSGGAYPLFYLINDEGKWCYFMRAASPRGPRPRRRRRSEKRGFVRPESWCGPTAVPATSLDPSRGESHPTASRLLGPDALSDEVRGRSPQRAKSCRTFAGAASSSSGAFDDRLSPTVWPSRYGKRMPH